MRLSGMGKLMINSLKEEGLVIKSLRKEKFLKAHESDVSSLNGFYNHESDSIFINLDGWAKNKEYILLHEAIHAVRAHKHRVNRIFNKETVHKTMKEAIKSASEKTKNPKTIYTIFLKKAKEDIRSWREEAIADCLSLFMLIEYGSKTTRSSIDSLRATFIPFAFKDAYNEKDKKKFSDKVKKECILTLDYILFNYMPGMYSPSIVIERFKSFFDKEIDYCNNYIVEKEKSQNKIIRRGSLSSEIDGKQIYQKKPI